MKRISWLFCFFIFSGLGAVSQDSICHLYSKEIKKFSKGYIVTSNDDTINGLIYLENDTGLFFINSSRKIDTIGHGKPSKVPYIPSDYPIVKSFSRDGVMYENCHVPPDNRPLYLTVLERGQLTLFALIRMESGGDEVERAMGVWFLGGIMGSLLYSASQETGSSYYSITRCYLRKKDNSELIFIPGGEKRFRDVFIPLIRDNKAFVSKLADQPLDYQHLRSLVKQYNSMSNRR